MLVIVYAFSKFRKYLVGRHFVFRTDLNERQQKWVSKVHEYYFETEYVKGKKNVFVDISTSLSMLDISKN